MKVAFIGDIALFGNLSLRNNSSLVDYFKDVSEYLQTEDYVIGNLESPFSEKQRTHGAKSAYLCSEPENVRILKLLNVHAVSLANNHMFDYGKEGYETTKRLLTENNISYFGSEGKDLLLQFESNRLAIAGFCCYSSGPLKCVPFGRYGVNEYNVGNVIKRIGRFAEAGYLNVLCVHAGVEHVNYPSLDTIKAARYMAKEHPVLYIGHHPHVAQGIERVNSSLIAYSLGNFCFDDVYSSVSKRPLIELSENNRSSFILEVTIEHNQICSYNIVPIYIGKEKMILGKGVSDKDITEYTDVINKLADNEYQEFRDAIIDSYLRSRKTQRNVAWYCKRLRPRYLGIIINSIIRKHKYNNAVIKYIKNYEGSSL